MVMDVLVTGGHGAIGRLVVDELVGRGHDVTVFDLQGDDQLQRQHGHAFVQGDITDPNSVNDAVANRDAIVHMAALKRPACNADPKLAHDVNIGGTVNVLDATAGTDTRIVHISSKSVFGEIGGSHAYPLYEALDEGGPKQSIGDVYGLTKAATESYMRAYVRAQDVDAASFRFGSSYGPGKVAVPGKGMLLPELIEGAPRGDPITVPGGDEQNDWIYFGDIANGLADAVEASALNYPVYHIGSGRLHSLRDFVAVLRDACPDANITVESGLNPQDKDHPLYARLDISRARTDLGYEPAYSLREGIRDYLDRIGADHELA